MTLEAPAGALISPPPSLGHLDLGGVSASAGEPVGKRGGGCAGGVKFASLRAECGVNYATNRPTTGQDRFQSPWELTWRVAAGLEALDAHLIFLRPGLTSFMHDTVISV